MGKENKSNEFTLAYGAASIAGACCCLFRSIARFAAVGAESGTVLVQREDNARQQSVLHVVTVLKQLVCRRWPRSRMDVRIIVQNLTESLAKLRRESVHALVSTF